MNTPEPNLTVAEADALIFWYKNYRGEEGYRRIIPISIRFGVSEWHGEKPQWLMLGIDTEKSVEREFAMSDMKNFVGPAVIRATPIPDTSAGEREVVQQSIATKQSTDATGDSASETATEAERERCAAIVQMARFGEIDQDFRAIISIIEGGMTIEQIKEFCS